MDMKEEKLDKVCCYCVAFPATEGFQKVVCRIPTTPRQLLGLNVISVKCTEGLIKLRRPQASDEIDLRNFDELFHAS